MPRMMPHDEESGKSRDGRTSKLPERAALSQGRRQSVTPGRKTPKARNFYSDEHPEIPKVRRASLSTPSAIEREEELTETSAHLPRVTARMTRVVRPRVREVSIESDEDEEWEEGYRSRVTTRMTRAVHPRVEKVRRERDEGEEWGESGQEVEPRSTNKILVSRRKPSGIYEPPRRRYGQPRGIGSGNGLKRRHLRRTKRPVLSPMIFMRRFTQRSEVMPAVGIVLILTVLLFVLAHLPAATGVHLISIGGASTAGTATPGVAMSAANTEHPSPPVLAQAAYLMDVDSGATLYSYNQSTRLPILSTTKMMTALIAVEKGNLNQSITINDEVANDIEQLSTDSSLMGIKKGETYTLKELLYGLMLVSGNDAAVVIADLIAGSQQAFVNEMNTHASQLGLHDTHFMNPHGLLNPNHYSSAHDLAVIAKNSLGNAQVHAIVSTREYTIPNNAQHAGRVLENGDQFLWWYPGADVGKQGWDGASNFVQVVSCVRNNRHLIGVVIHTVNWWTDMRDLMNWGFNNYTWVSPRDASKRAAIPFSADWNYFVSDKKDNTIPTADGGQYYIYTGYSVSNPVLNYFDSNKGLASFGYPLGQAQTVSASSLSQRFEHGTIQCDKQQNGQWECRKA